MLGLWDLYWGRLDGLIFVDGDVRFDLLSAMVVGAMGWRQNGMGLSVRGLFEDTGHWRFITWIEWLQMEKIHSWNLRDCQIKGLNLERFKLAKITEKRIPVMIFIWLFTWFNDLVDGETPHLTIVKRGWLLRSTYIGK
jgi:hypothetical protein